MKNLLSALFVFISLNAFSQQNFTRKDSLFGSLRPERTCFDVLHYDLNLKVNPSERAIAGYNEILFKVVEPTKRIQLDLFQNMKIDSIVWNGSKLTSAREFNAVFVDFPESLKVDSEQKVRFYYSGNPIVAKQAPWDGGFVYEKDRNNNPWIGVAVQGTGASLWYPVKDSQTDEPDNGVTMSIAVPNGLMDVSNGRFKGSEAMENDYTAWKWEVVNPINSYDVTLNIGDYVHFGENYKGLDLDYYVLRENEPKARVQFEQVKPMMDCFQSKFGNYPFPEDGYKLVETHYLGMEHQSAVAYGNHYENGYLGNSLSDSGIGMQFDYIIIHESGHEWFGNSITSKDIADMWIHEGFTCYSETVFVECQGGYDKGLKYVNGLKSSVANDRPIIGHYGVQEEGSTDMYFKGALMLNTIRSIINDDAKWWKILLEYSNTFRHKIIDTQTVIAFFNAQSGYDLTSVFNQYLKHTSIPILEIKHKSYHFQYRWKTDEPNFKMPVDVKTHDKVRRLNATNEWQTATFSGKKLEVQKDRFYIQVR